MKETKAIYLLAFLFAGIGILFAQSDADSIAQGKALVESKASCDNLSEAQLESIGEYYMEQMHPGKQHEYMDSMMGGEGSESLRSAHMQMAQVLYCGKTDTQLTYGGMMGMGMMGGGMMGGYGTGGYGMMGRGMMGSGALGTSGYGMMGYGSPYFAGWGITDILVVILLIGLILLVYAHAFGKLKEGKEKKK